MSIFKKEEKEYTLVKSKELASLRKSYRHLDLKPGDKVRWKEGMKNRKWPDYGDPVEVFQVFPIKTSDGKGDAGSTAFLEELDFSVAFWNKQDGKDVLGVYAFDSRRFELI